MKLTRLPQAYGRNIIVKLDKSEEKTDGGIISVGTLSNFSTGEVASVASLCLEDCVGSDDIDFDCVIINEGERLMFPPPYMIFDFEGDNYAVIRFTDVIAKL